MSDSDSEMDMNTPPDIVNATNNLLPQKSRAKYKKAYKDLLHYTGDRRASKKLAITFKREREEKLHEEAFKKAFQRREEKSRNKDKYLPEMKKHCHNLTTILSCSNATPFKDRNDAGYICAYCYESYPDPVVLRAHTHSDHQDEKRSYKAGSALNNFIAYLDIVDLKCTLCDSPKPDLKTLIEHLVAAHQKEYYLGITDYIVPFKLTEEIQINCCLCDEPYFNMKLLMQHMNIHYRNFICTICGAGFVNSFRLLRHETTHEKKKSSFPCKQCGAVFSADSKRKAHINEDHKGIAGDSVCRICKARFKNYYQKTRHMVQVHNAEGVKCEVCEKTFNLKSNLISHMRNVHLKERPYECSVCSMGFFIKRQMLYHYMATHTNERNYKCDVCGKAYATQCSKRKHMKKNHGMAPSLASKSRGAKNTVSTKFIGNDKSEKKSDAKSGNNTNGSKGDKKKASENIDNNDPEKVKKINNEGISRKDDVGGNKKDSSGCRNNFEQEGVIVVNDESKKKIIQGDLIEKNVTKQRSVHSKKSTIVGRDDAKEDYEDSFDPAKNRRKKRSIQDDDKVQENKRFKKNQYNIDKKSNGKERSKKDPKNVEKKSASKEISKKDTNTVDDMSKSKETSKKDSISVEHSSSKVNTNSLDNKEKSKKNPHIVESATKKISKNHTNSLDNISKSKETSKKDSDIVLQSASKEISKTYTNSLDNRSKSNKTSKKDTNIVEQSASKEISKKYTDSFANRSKSKNTSKKDPNTVEQSTSKEISKKYTDSLANRSKSKETSKKDPNTVEHRSKSKDSAKNDSNNVENRSKSRDRTRSRGPDDVEKKIKFFRPFLDEDDDDYEKKREKSKSREKSNKSASESSSSYGKNKSENKNLPKERSNEAKDVKAKMVTKKKVDTGKLKTKTVDQPRKSSSAVQTRTGNDNFLLEIDLTEIDKHLHNIRTILLSSNATPIQTHNETGFTCGFCVSQFLSAADLKIHTLDDHDEDYIERFLVGTPLDSYVVKLDITSLRCIMCTRKIFTLENLIEHLETKHNKMFYKDIKNHILPFKFQSDVFSCVICDRKFDRFRHMQHHMSVHYKNFICDECNAPFINRCTIRTHLTRHKYAVFKCDFCGKTFDTQNKCSVHETYVHMKGHSRNRCTYCYEFFVRYKSKMDHMVQVHGHKQRTVKCNSCSKTFKSKEKFTKHNKRYHLLERNYSCGQCESRFFDSYDLKRHQRTVHENSKKFECTTCDKKFTRRDNMLEHMRLHTQEFRKYTCEYCGWNYANLSRYNSHVKRSHKDRVIVPLSQRKPRSNTCTTNKKKSKE